LPILVMTAKSLTSEERTLLGQETQALFQKSGPWREQLVAEIDRVIHHKWAKAASQK